MQISRIAEIDEINEITKAIVSELQPEQVYLFGSFAKGTQTEESDYDFFVIVPDGSGDVYELAGKAHYALYDSDVKFNRPVDIIVDEAGSYQKYKKISSLQHEVDTTGVCVYGRKP